MQCFRTPGHVVASLQQSFALAVGLGLEKHPPKPALEVLAPSECNGGTLLCHLSLNKNFKTDYT